MLAKIEDAYLNLLRLAILIVAGLALVAAAGGLIFGAIKAGQGLFASDMDARGQTLGEFIIEKRLAAEQSDAPRASATPKTADPVALSEGIEAAAEVFTRYLNRQARNTISKAELVTRWNDRWMSTPAAYQAAYDASLQRLTREISASTGRPLNRDRVLELIDWHHASFAAEAQRLQVAREESSAEAWMWIGRAAQAFLLFVAIAFYFLLVRVERHLRLVRVARPDEPATAAETGPGAQT